MINSFRGEYAWLSNMASVDILHGGLTFPSVENAYMWEKCRDCIVEINEADKIYKFWEVGEQASWTQFCLLMPPNIVKKKSREVKLREDWNDIKLHIMYKLLKLKFSYEPFKSKLIATGLENIVEANFWNDKFWGVDVKVTPNEGENWLGRLIMDIRNKIRK